MYHIEKKENIQGQTKEIYYEGDYRWNGEGSTFPQVMCGSSNTISYCECSVSIKDEYLC